MNMSSSDQVSIKIDEVKKIASTIKENKDKIISEYNNVIVPVLTSSSEYLKVSGLNYDNVRSAFKDLFDLVNSEIVSMTTDLTERVIPNYESLKGKNSNLFN